ncbi:hypothetical protein Gotur_030718 [Gossypium turneri]
MRVSGGEADTIIAKLGFKHSYGVDASGFSRESGLGGRIMFKLSSDMRKRKFLWEGLNSVLPSSEVPWLVIRDFNVIIYSIKKKGGRREGKRYPNFDNFVEFAQLHDLGSRGPSFTRQKEGLDVIGCIWSPFVNLDPVEVWPLVKENLLWSILLGHLINYWRGPWILNYGPLVNDIPSQPKMEREYVLSEMVTVEGL